MSLSGLKVLLAEDNPTNQMVAVQMLESLDAQVSLAVDGAEAWDMLCAQKFDVALVDIEMPEVSGIDLIRRVRGLDTALADLPMIALTAYVMREHRAAIDDAGADGIIAKPILSIEEFGDEILKYIRQRREASKWTHTIDADDLADTPDIPVSPPADDDGPEIDWDVFARLCSSFRGAALDDLMVQVAKDISAARARAATGIAARDMGELRASTHVLISVAGTIGASKLRDLSQCLNSAGHAADNDLIGREGPKLLAEADRVLAFILGD